MNKLFEQLNKNEDTIAYDVGDDGDTKAVNIDSDEVGKYIRFTENVTIRIKDNEFKIYESGKEIDTLPVDKTLAFCKACLSLFEAVKKTGEEDGTAADLGTVPQSALDYVKIDNDIDELIKKAIK